MLEDFALKLTKTLHNCKQQIIFLNAKFLQNKKNQLGLSLQLADILKISSTCQRLVTLIFQINKKKRKEKRSKCKIQRHKHTLKNTKFHILMSKAFFLNDQT